MPSVRDIMDPAAPSVGPDTTIEEVVHLLARSEVAAVPVVNEGDRCVGVITESDLVIADDERDLKLPHMVSLFGGVVFLDSLKRFEDRLRKASAATAADMMTADPVTVEIDADARDAARLMTKEGHNRLPVTEHGRYVGLVSRADVLEALAGL